MLSITYLCVKFTGLLFELYLLKTKYYENYEK